MEYDRFSFKINIKQKVEYNKLLLKDVNDNILDNYERIIYGDKSEYEKVCLELETILSYCKKSDALIVFLINYLLDYIYKNKEIDNNSINRFKQLICVLNIHFGMDYGFYKTVKYLDNNSLEIIISKINKYFL